MTAFTAVDDRAYEDAITHFGKAIDLLDVPTLRVGRAEAFFQIGKWLEAKADYAAALGYTLQPGDSATFARSQVTAKSRLQSLELRIPALRVRTTADFVDVTVDEPPAVRLLRGEPLAINPGPHRVLVAAAGSAVMHTIEAGDGQVITVEGPKPAAETTATIVTIPTAPPTSALTSRTDEEASTELVIAASLTGAFAVATVITGSVFLAMKSEYDKANHDDTVSYERRVELRSRAAPVLTVLHTLAGTTVVAAGVTTYLWLAPRFANDTASQAHSKSGPAAFTATGLWLGAAGHF